MLYFLLLCVIILIAGSPPGQRVKAVSLYPLPCLYFFNFFHTRPRPCLANGVYYPPLPASYNTKAALPDGSSVSNGILIFCYNFTSTVTIVSFLAPPCGTNKILFISNPLFLPIPILFQPKLITFPPGFTTLAISSLTLE